MLRSLDSRASVENDRGNGPTAMVEAMPLRLLFDRARPMSKCGPAASPQTSGADPDTECIEGPIQRRKT